MQELLQLQWQSLRERSDVSIEHLSLWFVSFMIIHLCQKLAANSNETKSENRFLTKAQWDFAPNQGFIQFSLVRWLEMEFVYIKVWQPRKHFSEEITQRNGVVTTKKTCWTSASYTFDDGFTTNTLNSCVSRLVQSSSDAAQVLCNLKNR